MTWRILMALRLCSLRSENHGSILVSIEVTCPEKMTSPSTIDPVKMRCIFSETSSITVRLQSSRSNIFDMTGTYNATVRTKAFTWVPELK